MEWCPRCQRVVNTYTEQIEFSHDLVVISDICCECSTTLNSTTKEKQP